MRWRAEARHQTTRVPTRPRHRTTRGTAPPGPPRHSTPRHCARARLGAASRARHRARHRARPLRAVVGAFVGAHGSNGGHLGWATVGLAPPGCPLLAAFAPERR